MSVDLLKVAAKIKSAEADQGSATADDFFGEQGFEPERMGRWLNRQAAVKLGKDGRLYRYRDGVYRPDGEDFAARQVRDLLGRRWRKRYWQEVYAWLRADEKVIGTEVNGEWLNLPNGRLCWRTGELTPHSPDDLDTIRVPVAWKPGAKCLDFEHFLTQVLPADCIAFALELIGYLLVPDNRFQKAVMLLGPTGTGKGTLLHVIRALLGGENVSALSLHALAEDRFAPAGLFGKLANICGDLDARTVERSDVFKMVTGQDVVTGQFKYGPLFEFVPYCRLLFSANEAPPTSDQTSAYFARWLVVPMTNTFRGTKVEDTGLRARLTAANELQGVLALVVPALRRLMARGRFQVPESISTANEAFRAKLDSVNAFLADECGMASPDAWTPKTALYSHYERWCERNGSRPLNSRNFASRLESDHGLTVTRRHGYPGFKGVACTGP